MFCPKKNFKAVKFIRIDFNEFVTKLVFPLMPSINLNQKTLEIVIS
jgi:hypothetical protein